MRVEAGKQAADCLLHQHFVVDRFDVGLFHQVEDRGEHADVVQTDGRFRWRRNGGFDLVRGESRREEKGNQRNDKESAHGK